MKLPSSLQYDIILAFQAGYLDTNKFYKCTMCKFGKRLALIPSYRGGLARKESRYNIMAEERKSGVSFSFSKRKPAIKSYSSEKNALSIDEDKVKDDEKDYIHSAEEKELKRYISVACSMAV